MREGRPPLQGHREAGEGMGQPPVSLWLGRKGGKKYCLLAWISGGTGGKLICWKEARESGVLEEGGDI